MRRLPAVCLLALLPLGGALPAGAVADDAAAVTAAERAAILALGPWPPAFRRDPSNRVSGRPLAIELGRRLFHDPRMSPIGYIGCVTCHQPDRSFTDNKARAHGLADLPRNTIALANLSQQRWFGWGGSSDSLWMASLRPMLDAREFGSEPAIVVRVFQRDEELARCYRAVFGRSPGGAAEGVMVNVAKALAAYQETLVSDRTAFDDFRDALARGDAAAQARYPAAAARGLRLFVGRLGCVACHAGPNFSDGGFHRASAASAASAQSAAAVDAGRAQGLRDWQGSRYNRRGAYNDDPLRHPAAAPPGEGGPGAFRTPGLRNVVFTAPYLHDGSLDTLREATLHAVALAAGAPPPPPTQLDDLLAFLASLADRHGERRPAPAPRPCP